MVPVSVIIPTYNRAAYLGRAIASVVAQKNFDGEIIVVDDGSTDGSVEAVRSVDSEQPLRYVYTEHQGVSAARNHGACLARCEYIAFLDSDDHWRPDKLDKQMSLLLHNREYSISHTGERWLRRGCHLNQKAIHLPRGGDIFEHCLGICCVGMSTVLMKKELFFAYGGFDTNLPCCEDYDLWLRISSSNKFLLVADALTVKEGGRVDQLSQIYRVGMDKYRIYALVKLLQEGQLSDTQRLMVLDELTKKCHVYGRGCIKHGRPLEGNVYLGLPEFFKEEAKR